MRVRVRVRVRVRACVCARACARVRVRACVRAVPLAGTYLLYNAPPAHHDKDTHSHRYLLTWRGKRGRGEGAAVDTYRHCLV